MNTSPSRFAVLCLLTITLACLTVPGSGTGRESPLLPLKTAEERALDNHPSLQELQARISASKARSISAGELPDPQLTLGLVNLPVDTFRMDQEPMTQAVIGLTQAIPYPGKLQIKSDLESRQGQFWTWQYHNMQAELVREVRNTYLQRFFLERSLDVIDNNLELFEELVTIARKKYVVGRGLQQDVLLAQTELDRIVDEKTRILDLKYRVNSRLTELMAVPWREFRIPDELPDLSEPPGPSELETGIDRHPAVRSREAMIRKMQAGVELARKEFYPDFNVNVAYGHRRAEEMDGDRLADFASARIMVELPLFTKDRQEQDLSSARLDKEAAIHKKKSLLLQLKNRIRSTWSELEKTEERARLFEQVIIPESRQTVEADTAAYVSGKLDFLELVRARLKQLQYELTLWRLRVEAQKARANLLYLADQGERK